VLVQVVVVGFVLQLLAQMAAMVEMEFQVAVVRAMRHQGRKQMLLEMAEQVLRAVVVVVQEIQLELVLVAMAAMVEAY
jgi:peptidoglycan biosynthesis protein MviN/MurJ (putative lipid II flippase)